MYAHNYLTVSTGRGMFAGKLKRKAMPEETAYEIRLQDVLDEKWSAYFAPFTLTFGADETILNGVAYDQAELFGILLRIRDLGLRLESVNVVPLQGKKPISGTNPPNSWGTMRIL